MTYGWWFEVEIYKQYKACLAKSGHEKRRGEVV